MTGKASGNKVNTRASSLILIFVVLYMTTFGLLSLGSAQGNLKLTGCNGEAVRAYYEVDNRGQQWLKEADQVLTEKMGEGEDSTQCDLDIKDRLEEPYNKETSLASTDIPMDRGQPLRVELTPMRGEKHYDMKSWYVYTSDEHEIDNSMPVWGGATPSQEQSRGKRSKTDEYDGIAYIGRGEECGQHISYTRCALLPQDWRPDHLSR